MRWKTGEESELIKQERGRRAGYPSIVYNIKCPKKPGELWYGQCPQEGEMRLLYPHLFEKLDCNVQTCFLYRVSLGAQFEVD